MPEKYCSCCPKKLNLRFFVKNQTIPYTPITKLYSACYICREKRGSKRKRTDTVSDPTLTTLLRLVTYLLGPFTIYDYYQPSSSLRSATTSSCYEPANTSCYGPANASSCFRPGTLPWLLTNRPVEATRDLLRRAR